jgi:hypothetical protein
MEDLYENNMKCNYARVERIVRVYRWITQADSQRVIQ